MGSFVKDMKNQTVLLFSWTTQHRILVTKLYWSHTHTHTQNTKYSSVDTIWVSYNSVQLWCHPHQYIRNIVHKLHSSCCFSSILHSSPPNQKLRSIALLRKVTQPWQAKAYSHPTMGLARYEQLIQTHSWCWRPYPEWWSLLFLTQQCLLPASMKVLQDNSLGCKEDLQLFTVQNTQHDQVNNIRSSLLTFEPFVFYFFLFSAIVLSSNL